MKKYAALLFGAVYICSLRPSASAQESTQMPPEQKAWMEYMTPGAMHAHLKTSEGKWKVRMTSWSKPDAPPETSEGESVSTMILGGRYLQSTFKGTFMGSPYNGIGFDAYDNALGEFRSIWLDDMGTGVMTMTGKMDPKTKVIAYKGKMVDPMSKKENDCWTTLAQDGPDHQTFSMYSMVKGKKMKTMELKYERVK